MTIMQLILGFIILAQSLGVLYATKPKFILPGSCKKSLTEVTHKDLTQLPLKTLVKTLKDETTILDVENFIEDRLKHLVFTANKKQILILKKRGTLTEFIANIKLADKYFGKEFVNKKLKESLFTFTSFYAPEATATLQKVTSAFSKQSHLFLIKHFDSVINLKKFNLILNLFALKAQYSTSSISNLLTKSLKTYANYDIKDIKNEIKDLHAKTTLVIQLTANSSTTHRPKTTELSKHIKDERLDPSLEDINNIWFEFLQIVQLDKNNIDSYLDNKLSNKKLAQIIVRKIRNLLNSSTSPHVYLLDISDNYTENLLQKNLDYLDSIISKQAVMAVLKSHLHLLLESTLRDNFEKTIALLNQEFGSMYIRDLYIENITVFLVLDTRALNSYLALIKENFSDSEYLEKGRSLVFYQSRQMRR